LTVDEIEIVCEEPSAVFAKTPDGKLWPVNGMADTHAERYGAEPSIDPIWSINEEMTREMNEALEETGEPPYAGSPIRVGIGDLIQYGLERCQ